MKSYPTLAQFKVNFGTLSREAFLAKFPDPFLVIEFGKGEKGKGALGSVEDATADWDQTSWDKDRAEGRLQAIVVPVVPLTGEKGASPITLGRSAENDVVVPHPSVSKRHACFVTDQDTGALSIQDTGSTYGTTLDGQLLREGVSAPLANRSILVFAGSALATFFLAEAFYDYMHLMVESE
ncbi:MAG: FHA domain-containing protein [Planctomycetota bacterium]|jgi:hypothetical protein